MKKFERPCFMCHKVSGSKGYMYMNRMAICYNHTYHSMPAVENTMTLITYGNDFMNLFLLLLFNEKNLSLVQQQTARHHYRNWLL